MKTSFDLPEPLLRRAKATAAQQGRPLRDLVADALAKALDTPSEATVRRSEPPPDEWAAYLATLVQQPDGTYINPNGIDDEAFFDALDDIRAGRLSGQTRLFAADDSAHARPGQADAQPAEAVSAPPPKRA